MNERIHELFEQALEEFNAENKYATIIVPNPLKEKFAELIVKECMNVLDPGGHQLIARFHTRQWLSEHFGVK